MLAAGEHHPDMIDEGCARAIDDDLRRVLEIETDDEVGDGLGGLDRRGVRGRLLRLCKGRPTRQWRRRKPAADNTNELPPPHGRLQVKRELNYPAISPRRVRTAGSTITTRIS